jgi:hypothetical protein
MRCESHSSPHSRAFLLLRRRRLRLCCMCRWILLVDWYAYSLRHSRGAGVCLSLPPFLFPSLSFSPSLFLSLTHSLTHSLRVSLALSLFETLFLILFLFLSVALSLSLSLSLSMQEPPFALIAPLDPTMARQVGRCSAVGYGSELADA